MMFFRSARQRDVQHLHQQLWLCHRDHHGEGFANVMGSSPSALGLAVALPGSVRVPVLEPMAVLMGPASPSVSGAGPGTAVGTCRATANGCGFSGVS